MKEYWCQTPQHKVSKHLESPEKTERKNEYDYLNKEIRPFLMGQGQRQYPNAEDWIKTGDLKGCKHQTQKHDLPEEYEHFRMLTGPTQVQLYNQKMDRKGDYKGRTSLTE